MVSLQSTSVFWGFLPNRPGSGYGWGLNQCFRNYIGTTWGQILTQEGRAGV